VCYLMAQVRTGKTIMALEATKEMGRVLFLTKKMAMGSVVSDYENMGYTHQVVVMNYESVHKVEGEFDVVVLDEAHRLGAFPKAGKVAKYIRERFKGRRFLLMSGTPTPESYSQIFHPMWVCGVSWGYVNFYAWAKEFVEVRRVWAAQGLVNDYSMANKEKVDKIMENYKITFTQQDAGFATSITEHIVEFETSSMMEMLMRKLRKDKVVEGNTTSIVADSGVKLMGKLHQLSGGTCIMEDGSARVLCWKKAEFIRDMFSKNRIGIYYKFKAEWEAIKEVMGDTVTNDIVEFQSGEVRNIALQIVSGREGITLRDADYIVYYNIDFSAVSYWQSRDRMSTLNRESNEVYFVVGSKGIERRVLRMVMEKKDYTLSQFRKEEKCWSE
jgi:hypothetical protein